MLRTLLALTLALAVSSVGAQIVNRPVAANAISNPGTTAPATCAVGGVFFKSDATAGQNLELCTAANTWTQLTGGGLANPVTVLQGGTGRATSTTAYGLLAAGTTSTGTQQTLAAGATTEILVGGGASALPVWTTASGSGAPIRATSPSLTTPTLGVATATSVTFGGSALSTYTTSTFTVTLTGCSAGTTGTAFYTVIGNKVTVEYPILTCTSNATTKTLTGQPAAIQPVTMKEFIAMVSDNAAAYGSGLARVAAATGVVSLSKDVNGTAFTASGTYAQRTMSFAYTLQ